MSKKQEMAIDWFAGRLRYIATIPNRIFNWKEEDIELARNISKIQLISAYKEGLRVNSDDMSEIEMKKLANDWFNETHKE